MGKFVVNRGQSVKTFSNASSFADVQYVRFSVSKSVSITNLGFFGVVASNFSTNVCFHDAICLKLEIAESCLNDVEQNAADPVIFLEEQSYEIEVTDSQLESNFQCRLKRAVLIPKNVVIDIRFMLKVLGDPEARFFRLPDEHPVYQRMTDSKSGVEFTFYSSSKQLASISFDVPHEIWGIGVLNVSDGQTLFYSKCSGRVPASLMDQQTDVRSDQERSIAIVSTLYRCLTGRRGRCMIL